MKIETCKTPPAWVNKKRGGRRPKYPFKTLEVGQLAVIPFDEMGCQDLASFRALAYNRGQALGKVFKCNQRKDGAYELYRAE